jgi:hypothetical protein
MIDLAGSERASVTKNRGDRLKEGANINRSLLALANCINTLATNGSRASSRRMVRVKYRDSKLTHLLKSSLEGNCRLVMITCVAPAHLSYEESHNSLKYVFFFFFSFIAHTHIYALNHPNSPTLTFTL